MRVNRKVKTRVFEIASARGISLRRLAVMTGMDISALSRIRTGERAVTSTFIAAAHRAFPLLSLSELFYVEEETIAS